MHEPLSDHDRAGHACNGRTACVLLWGAIAITLLIVGVTQIGDPHSASALMLVDAANCTDESIEPIRCRVDVEFALGARSFHAAAVPIETPTVTSRGSRVKLFYDPGNPADVTQTRRPQPAGVGLVSAGTVVGVINLGLALRRMLRGICACVIGATEA